MARETEPYKRTNSIKTGLSSVFGGSGKQYYVLEHKISSQYHKMGESQEIIIDSIELGRDPKCQVRFDDSFSTVSRRHAAIVKDGEKWKLVQLSKTNPTFLNGNKVGKEWYLQNGDDIQLAIGGPRLGFIVPTGKNSTIGSIGLSRRLSLFRQQALRPYKQAITALSIVLFLAVGGLTGFLILKDNEHKGALARWERESEMQDSIRNERFIEVNAQLARADSVNAALKRDMERRIASLQNAIPPAADVSVRPSQNSEQAVRACEPHVYHIRSSKIVMTLGNETQEVEYGWLGTGFMLNDGRFVTARHVAEPWFFFVEGGEVDQSMLFLNKVANNGGKVVAHFTAYSSSGESFSFKSEQFVCNRRQDVARMDDEDNATVKLATLGDTDWAYFKRTGAQGLKHDKRKSTSVERNVELIILGFPLGLGANSPTDIVPQQSSGTTTANGLTNGVILTANSSYEQGNSGGPVFYADPSGNLSVVGIVSAGAGRSTGFIVPIAAIDNN